MNQGFAREPIRREMKALADHLAGLGGEAVIAGCTEVPLVMSQDDIRLPFIDSTERLAQAVTDIAYGVREFSRAGRSKLRPPR